MTCLSRLHETIVAEGCNAKCESRVKWVMCGAQLAYNAAVNEAIAKVSPLSGTHVRWPHVPAQAQRARSGSGGILWLRDGSPEIGA